MFEFLAIILVVVTAMFTICLYVSHKLNNKLG
jgi:hypothetical protein